MVWGHYELTLKLKIASVFKTTLIELMVLESSLRNEANLSQLRAQ